MVTFAYDNDTCDDSIDKGSKKSYLRNTNLLDPCRLGLSARALRDLALRPVSYAFHWYVLADK